MLPNSVLPRLCSNLILVIVSFHFKYLRNSKIHCPCNDCPYLSDGTAVMYDCHHHTTHVTRLSLLPAFAVWHPSSAVCLLASAEGQLQFLDAGLGSLR